MARPTMPKLSMIRCGRHNTHFRKKSIALTPRCPRDSYSGMAASVGFIAATCSRSQPTETTAILPLGWGWTAPYNQMPTSERIGDQVGHAGFSCWA